ncbi:MAG: hypothetical protein DMG58_35680 [Acidobacteria bacterium]|nr:MAG: hypothetical protein DMG58_35680 [Acidobacteriota bacterium]
MIWQQDALLALRVLIAAVLGGLIGWQREHVGIEAGVRTFAAVSLGACAFGLISQIQTGDTRISAQIVRPCTRPDDRCRAVGYRVRRPGSGL